MCHLCIFVALIHETPNELMKDLVVSFTHRLLRRISNNLIWPYVEWIQLSPFIKPHYPFRWRHLQGHKIPYRIF